MFPLSLVDKTQCLESLLGIRSACDSDTQYPFVVEDIEGFDVKKFSKMAKSSNPSGKDFIKQLINTSARMMLGNIETLLTDGYGMKSTFADMCSTCEILPIYTANGGIVIRPSVSTQFGIARVSRLTILTNVTGTREISIDDGVNIVLMDVELVADVLTPVTLNYVTTQKSIKIRFTDISVGVGKVQCPAKSGCGCGGGANTTSPVIISGLLGAAEVTAQYGFLPCVSVDCSYDTLVCDLVNRLPNVFGLAMLYKFGELAFANELVSSRNNDEIAYNDEQDKLKPTNYAQRYWATMKGTKGMEGINRKISDYLRTVRNDKCIVCETKVRTAYVTG